MSMIGLSLGVPRVGPFGGLVVGAVSGTLFGYGLAKSRCIEPNALRGQMLFRNHLMMKLFMGSVVTANLGSQLYLLFMAGEEGSYSDKLPVDYFHPLMDFVGGGCLGFGIAFAGGCPGTSPTAAGLGLWRRALGTFLGSFFGTWLWAVTPQHVLDWFLIEDPHRLTLAELMGVNYTVLSLGMDALMLGVVFLLDYLSPLEKELDYDPKTMHIGYNPLKNKLSHKAWHPMWGGTLLGVGSTLGYFTMRSTMGSSSGFFAIPGLLMRVLPSSLVAMLDPQARYAQFYANDWKDAATVNGLYRAALLSCIPLGGYMSAKQSKSSGETFVRDYFDPTSKHSSSKHCDGSRLDIGIIVRSFIGATVFSWGTRLSRGCTSGHGVSGMGIQSPASVTYVCGVFAVGIAMAYAEWFLGKRPSSDNSKPKFQ